jgi:hypothetical protein
MAAIKKNREEPGGIEQLVVGTESKQILILDPAASSVLKKAKASF